MLNRSGLKWIAVLSMVTDHVGAIFFPETIGFRVIGRLAFPIYAYCLAEGYLHTGNFWKYFSRLAVLAVLSEIPFDLALFGTVFDREHQNIFFTLALGLLFLKATECYQGKIAYDIAAALAFALAAEFFHMDYGMGGILMILAFLLILQKKWENAGWGIFALTNIVCFRGAVQWAALAAAVPVGLYDRLPQEQKPAKGKQRFFYWIYPLHLLLLWIVAKYMGIR